jgi:hypothetical protein
VAEARGSAGDSVLYRVRVGDCCGASASEDVWSIEEVGGGGDQRRVVITKTKGQRRVVITKTKGLMGNDAHKK